MSMSQELTIENEPGIKEEEEEGDGDDEDEARAMMFDEGEYPMSAASPQINSHDVFEDNLRAIMDKKDDINNNHEMNTNDLQ